MKGTFFIKFIVAVISIIFIGAILGAIILSRNKHNLSTSENNDETVSDTKITNNDASLPKPSDTINLFFQLANESKIDDALKLLSTKITGTEPVQANSILQGWGVTLNGWNGSVVKNIQEVSSSDTGINTHIYKVSIMITLKTDTLDELWSSGINTRWITVEKEGNKWLITKIATSL